MFKFKSEAFKQDILIDKYNNNLEKCAKELNLSKKILSNILNEKYLLGITTLKRIIFYCKKNNLDSKKYIHYNNDEGEKILWVLLKIYLVNLL